MATISNRWIQQGLEQGLEQGVQQGLEQGLQRGAAKAREYVLEVLEARSQSVPQALQTRIEGLEDLAVLSQLHKTALTAASLEDFEQQMDDSHA